MVKELSPQYTGYFIADGTSISIQKEKYQLLLIADVESQDIPYAALCKTEDYESWKMVLKGLRDRIHCPALIVLSFQELTISLKQSLVNSNTKSMTAVALLIPKQPGTL